MMKRLYVLAIILTLLSSSWVTRTYKSSGPASCHAGEPPNFTNCTNCHDDGTANTGNALIAFDLGGAEGGYLPGETYTISVTISNPGMKRAGFQTIALLDNDNKISPGEFILTDIIRTQRVDKTKPHSGGCLNEERVWIEHNFKGSASNDSGISRWQYDWKAPDSSVGPITFYLGALEANNDLSAYGDQVYTKKLTIPGLATGFSQRNKDSYFQVYPIPANDRLFIQSGTHPVEKVELFTSSGVRTLVWEQADIDFTEGQVELAMDKVKPGVYFVHIHSKGQSHSYKVLVF